MVKLASTKRKRMAQHGGTAGQMVTASHGHLNIQTQAGKKEKTFPVLVFIQGRVHKSKVLQCF